MSVGSGSADNEEVGSSGRADEPKKQRKRKGAATEPGKAPTRKRARGVKAQQRGARKRKETSEPEKEIEDVDTASGAEAPPALAAKLRPRSKPNYQGPAAEDGQENEADDSDSDDEFVVKRR